MHERQELASSRLLARDLPYWVMHQTQYNLNQIVWINLERTVKGRRTNEARATTISLMTVERTLLFLRKLKTRAEEWEKLTEEEPRRTYDDNRFFDLGDKMRTRLRTQGTRVWVIRNAHQLDTQAIEYVVESWKEVDKRVAVILAGKADHDQTVEDVLKDQIAAASDVGRYKVPTMYLRRIEETEFNTIVLPDVFIDLQAEIGSDVDNDSLFKRAWTYTAGHWDSTTMLATIFDDELGEAKIVKVFDPDLGREVKRRLLTQAIVDRAFERLMPTLKL